MPLFPRIIRCFWRFIHGIFRLPLLSQYIQSYPSHNFTSAYRLLEYLGPDTGRLLSDTFDAQRGNLEQRQQLFRGMSRIMLSLANIPQPRIGSFFFDDSGIVTLTNRPLCCSTMILEDDTGARSMQRGDTYTCTDAYVSDMHALHDQRSLGQPNAVNDEQSAYGHAFSLRRIMRLTLDSKGVWFWYCLSSVNAIYFLLEAHILPAKSLRSRPRGSYQSS